MVAEDTTTRYVRSYTAMLMALGLLMALEAVMMHTMSLREEDPWTFILVRNLSIFIASVCLLVAALRALESRLAGAATVALGWLMAPCFPVGTAVFIWWLVSVRKREQPDRAEA